MKKLVFAFGVLALIVSQASAFSFYPGPNDASYVDFGAAFTGTDGRENMTPTTTPPAAGDEIRSIFWVDALKISGGSPYNGGSNPELTGLIYDLKCLYVDASVPGVHTYYYGAAGTYSSTFTGRMDLYADPSNDKSGFNGSATVSDPADWTAVANGSAPTATDSFPTYSNGDPLFSATFLPLLDPFTGGNMQIGGQDVLLIQTFNFTETGSTVGYAHLDIPDGYNFANAPITETLWNEYIPFLSDIRFYSGYQPNLSGDGFDKSLAWPTRSTDPVQFDVIPEPSTLMLLGTAFIGLVPVIRRRK